MLGGFSTSRTAVTSLWPRRQEPAFAILKQAPATARVPTANAAWLTRRQRAGKLKWAHGRVSSRAVRRREGGTSRRHFAADDVDAARPGSGGRYMPAYLQHFTRASGCTDMSSEGRPVPRSTNRGMAQVALR